MGDSSFISDFHNIEGVTVGERKKNLQRLLKNKLFTADEAQSVLDNLHPKTYLESLFCVDILIYLKKTDQLLKILKHGNEIFVKKIMKEQWFFEEAFSTVTAEEIVNDVLASTSFSVKMKLLKKLSIVLPEDKVNEIFDLVLKRYGLFIAVTVISGCSPQKIEEILKSNEIKLWTYQLKIIHSKRPDLVTVYLHQYKHQQPETILEKSFLKYLAQRDPILFWELVETFDFKIDLKLGRRTTKKLIVPKKHDIISKPKEYVKYFRHETLVRKLNKQGDFKELYRNLFPKNTEILDQEHSLCNELLKYYPKRDQYRLFTQTFTEVIQESIWSNTSCLKDHFIDLIDDKEIRVKWAQIKYKESNNDEYMKYYETDQCFNLIKEKINLTSQIKDRRNLLCTLVKCCGLNKDLQSLEKVLKYFCERHRNDDKTIRCEILNTIQDSFKVETFTNTHWKYLSEVFTIQSLNKEYTKYNSYLRIKYIEYLYKNNGRSEDKSYAVLEYIKDQALAQSMRLDSITILKNAEIEKEILLQAMEYLPNIMENQNIKNDKIYIQSQLIAEIFSYNLRHPDYQIQVFKSEYLIKLIRESFQADYASYAFYTSFGKVVCKLNRNNFENEVLKYYWEKMLVQMGEDKVLKWYVKHDPLTILEYFDEIMKAYPHVLVKIWSRIKVYTHINLDNMVLKHYLKQLNNDKHDDKTTLIPPLSFLSTPEDYIRIMEEHNFLPTSSKLVIDSEEERNIYKVQRTIVKNFKNIKEPLKLLPILIDKFCQGDYLQASLTSLYSSFHRCPENELKIYLDKLSNYNAVSAKKHSLFLACSAFDQQTVLQILKRFGRNEKNVSLQKCTFLSALKYFSKNPNEEFYEQVLFLMGLLKGHDIESLKILSTISISKNYKPSYIENIWKILEALKTNANEIEAGRFYNLMSSILDSIDTKCIQKLPSDFCKEIIQNNFLTNSETHQSSTSIQAFITKFLINRNEKSINFDFVFKLLSDYKSQFWDTSKRMALKSIHEFFNCFYSECYEKEITSDIIAQFSHYWENVFTPIETFEEYVLLNLLQIKKDAGPEQETYSKNIVLFSEKIEAEFGQIVFSKYITILAKFFDIKRQKLSNLLFNMLKYKTSVPNCILIMQLIILKGDLFYKDKIRRKYREIDSILQGVSDPNVQLYYNLYLKSGL